MAAQEKAAGVLVTPTTAHEEAHTPIIDGTPAADKKFATLQTQFALRGHELIKFPDGTFACSKWGLTRLLPTIAAVEAFLRQIGGEA